MADDQLSDLAAQIEDREAVTSLWSLDPSPGEPRDVYTAPGRAPRQVRPGEVLRDRTLVGEDGLPLDCPVIPLGTDHGRFFFLSTMGQVVSLTEVKAERIKGLFAGRINYLYWWAPRKKVAPKDMSDPDELAAWYSDPENINGWDANLIAEALYNACALKGVWRDFEMVRGRGAWQEEDGSLTLHCGNALFRIEGGKMVDLPHGPRGNFVYPGGPKRPYPHRAAQGVNPGQELLEIIETWNWRREIDAKLLLGWVGASMLAGALPWRPSFFLTGPRGTGKSSITRRLLKELLGEGAIYATNATAAGLYQHIGHDACPVILDQFEADANSSRSKAVIELARDSCSDGVVMRGGADHKGVEFKARNCFGFAAIRRPAMRPEDTSRMVFLQLDPFEDGATPPDLSPARLHGLGRRLLRRMLDRWSDFKDVFTVYHASLMDAGHDSRGADQFGVLLACADMMIMDGLPDTDTLSEVCGALAPTEMSEFEDTQEEWERCAAQLLSAPVDVWRSEKFASVGDLLAATFSADDDETARLGTASVERSALVRKANTKLRALGLKIEPRRRGEKGPAWWLSIPASDDKLRALFETSDFAGESGVGGAWSPALQQARRYDPETERGVWRSERSRVDGLQRRCTWMRIDILISAEERLDGSQEPASSELNDVPF